MVLRVLTYERRRAFHLAPPGASLPVLGCLIAIGAAAALAMLAASEWTGPGLNPAWFRLPEFENASAPIRRIALGSAGMIGTVLALLGAAACAVRATAIVGYQIGSRRAIESQGPSRLIQVPGKGWELQLDVGLGEPFPLIFPLDEATAGAVSRSFNPGEILQIRWCRVPLAFGAGPRILAITESEGQSRGVSDLDQELRAA